MLTVHSTTDLESQIYKDSLALRFKVFVAEQAVPTELEVEDEEICLHFTMYDNEQAVATARLYPIDDKRLKVQRVAVDKLGRGKGYGRDIMLHMEDYAKQDGFEELILGAQLHATPFYTKLGYEAFGEEYLDAGIKHTDMLKKI